MGVEEKGGWGGEKLKDRWMLMLERVRGSMVWRIVLLLVLSPLHPFTRQLVLQLLQSVSYCDEG